MTTRPQVLHNSVLKFIANNKKNAVLNLDTEEWTEKFKKGGGVFSPAPAFSKPV